MDTRNTFQTVGLAAIMATLPALIAIAAHAQTSTQTPSPATQTPSGVVKVLPPAEAAGSEALPGGAPTPSKTPSAAPAPSAGKSADAVGTSGAASTIKDVAVGSAVFGSDGQKIGEIKGVKADPGGKIEEIHVKTGGILGFGGKVIVIPGGKIAKGGKTVQVAMTVEDVGKLPAMVDPKS